MDERPTCGAGVPRCAKSIPPARARHTRVRPRSEAYVRGYPIELPEERYSGTEILCRVQVLPEAPQCPVQGTQMTPRLAASLVSVMADVRLQEWRCVSWPYIQRYTSNASI